MQESLEVAVGTGIGYAQWHTGQHTEGRRRSAQIVLNSVCMRRLYFLVIILGTSLVRAQLTDSYFLQFQSSFMEILTENSPYRLKAADDYPFWARAIRNDLFKWDPTGRSEPIEADCDFSQEQFLASKTADLTYLRDYFIRCEKKLRTGTDDVLRNAYLTDFIKLQPSHHPFARHVILHLPNGIKLKGLLALKGDSKPRPLVVLRLGIFSNTQEFFPERYVFLQMFEQSPFNMLILESLSGTEFLQNNTQYSLGGFDEGIQNYQVAAELQSKSEPFSKLIDSVHLFGISLGGHGVLYASLLNQLNPQAISSFAAFCPLINFKESFEYHQSHRFNISLMNYWASHRMGHLKNIFPELDLENFIPSLLMNLERSYSGALTLSKEEPINLPPSALAKGFFSKNDFWEDYKEIKTPVLIFATRKDPIVPFEINSRRLLEGEMPLDNLNLKVIPLEAGYHCTIPSAYNWKAWTMVLQSYVLKNSNVKLQEFEVSLPLGFKATEDFFFEATEQGLFVVQGSPWKFWAQERTVIPLDQTEWTGLHLPLNEATRSLLRRWAEQVFEVRPSSGQGLARLLRKGLR
jgi:hypothetical protein